MAPRPAARTPPALTTGGGPRTHLHAEDGRGECGAVDAVHSCIRSGTCLFFICVVDAWECAWPGQSVDRSSTSSKRMRSLSVERVSVSLVDRVQSGAVDGWRQAPAHAARARAGGREMGRSPEIGIDGQSPWHVQRAGHSSSQGMRSDDSIDSEEAKSRRDAQSPLASEEGTLGEV